MKKFNAGIIGCGMISRAYTRNGNVFKSMQVTACSDINMDVSKALAEEAGIKAMTVDELLADKKIQVVLNLTVPKVHADVTVRALKAGKHVYCEKPLAVTREDGRKILKAAAEKGLLVSS